jgi:hypothetical protein
MISILSRGHKRRRRRRRSEKSPHILDRDGALKNKKQNKKQNKTKKRVTM